MRAFSVFVAIMALACVTQAHVRIQYGDQTPALAIRNANGATGDGAFSVAGPCGGVANYGANGVSDIVAGTALNGQINYGTGTNGDHANAANVFQAFIQCGGSPTEADMRAARAADQSISGTVAAPDGSRPAKYNFAATIPADAEGQCTVSVMDQREWGACFDLNVAAAPCASMQAVDANGAVIGTWPETEKDATATLTCPEGTEGSVSIQCGPGAIFLAPQGQCLTADGEVPELNEDGTPVSSGGAFTPGSGGFTVMIIIVGAVVVVGIIGGAYFFFFAGAAAGSEWGSTKTTPAYGAGPASSGNFGGPQSSGYAPNSGNYGAPQSSYGGPQASYGGPQSSYGGPQSSYGGPQSNGYSHRPAPSAGPNSGYYAGGAPPPPSNRF